MPAIMEKGTIKTLTTHYIDGAFIESHGQQVMDIIKPTNGQVIARVTLGDEEDTRVPSLRPSAHSPASAGQARNSACVTCANYTRLCPTTSTI